MKCESNLKGIWQCYWSWWHSIYFYEICGKNDYFYDRRDIMSIFICGMWKISHHMISQKYIITFYNHAHILKFEN